MHLYADFSAPMPSLLEFCAVQVNTGIILACRSCSSKDTVKMSQAAIQRLELPKVLKATLRELMWSMNYCENYKYLHARYSPIFAPDGSMDMQKSTAAMLQDETLDIHRRLLVAAAFCHEEFIFQHCPSPLVFHPESGAEHSEVDRMLQRYMGRPLLKLWSDIVRVHGSAEDPGSLEQLYAEGLRCAGNAYNHAALKYFLGKASTATVTDFFRSYGRHNMVSWDIFQIAPATSCMLSSKLDERVRQDSKSFLCYALLKRLTDWRYRWLLGDTAGVLVDQLDAQDYCRLLDGPLCNASYRFYGEERVVSVLWRLGAAKRPALADSEDFKKMMRQFRLKSRRYYSEEFGITLQWH